MEDFFATSLADSDPAVYASISGEIRRQQDQIELIASENIVSKAVLQALGSPLTNKYAEGYPGRRYYQGCDQVDIAEQLAIERARQLFDCAFVNVQPHSGAQANGAVYLALMRPGDVLTHCFRPFPNAPATPQGTVGRGVREARERGVLFDIGHGKGSFAFKTARAMLANGFLPDTISSDVHQLSIDGPAFDLVTTMSKFLCMGVELAEVVRRATVNPAMAVRRPELGSLKPGSVGDATVLSVAEGAFDYVDVVGEVMVGDRKIVSEGVVIGGRWWHPR